MAKIGLVYDEDLLSRGYPIYIEWQSDAAPHLAIGGITGTGKTTLVKIILARIGLYVPKAQVTICDFKGDAAFAFLEGCTHYYRFEECVNGFNAFYDSFLDSQRSRQSDLFKVLVFDEWAGFLNYLPKKEGEELRNKLANLLMLGRSLNYHVILSQQRLDAEYFSKSRDNLSIVAILGNPSKEVQEMFFRDYKDRITNDRQKGTGYILINGADFKKICVPIVNDMDKVEHYIKTIVNFVAAK